MRGVLLILVFVFGFGSGCPTHLLAAINIVGYDAQKNDRFFNDPLFFQPGLDLSGVALADSGAGPAFDGDDGGRWVTMLSPNVFITAHHFAPPVGASVTFHQTNDAQGPAFTTSIEQTQRIGDTDIRLGTLHSALPVGYAYYDILNSPFSSAAPAVISVPDVLTFGRSPGDYAVTQDVAVGQNNMNLFYPEQSVGSATGDAGAMTFDDPGLEFESQFNQGDSGAPAMVLLEDGSLSLAGVNWFIGNLSEGDLQISAVSYLPNYQTEIQAYIDAHPAAASVPESSAATWLFGWMALAAVLTRRR